MMEVDAKMRYTASAHRGTLGFRQPNLRSVVRFALLLPAIFSLLVLSSNVIQKDSSSPVSAAAPAIMSVQSGNWTSASTWDLGRVPAAGEWIAVSGGDTVVYDDHSNNVYGEIDVEGTLRFSRTVDTRMMVGDNIFVLDGGHLDMGTPGDFIPVGTQTELTFQLTQAQADGYIGGPGFQISDIGLWAFAGSRWDTHGAPLNRTWSKLVEDAAIGSTSIVVENDVTDWYVGGNVILSQTTQPAHYYTRFDGRQEANIQVENEIAVIKAITPLANGNTQITFEQPTKFLHEGTAPFQGEAGLLTRNIKFSTEIIGRTEADYKADLANRQFAHTMWTKGALGDMQYAELKNMGNYLTLARYPVHPHMMGETARGKVIRGNGVWQTGIRWINIHSSSGVLVEDNVGFDSVGAGYFLEVDLLKLKPDANYFEALGKNVDVVFVHNLGVQATAKKFVDRDPQPNRAGEYYRHSTFWVTGHDGGVGFLGNVAAGTYGGRDTSGYHFPETTWVVDSTGLNQTMPLTFVKNEAHSGQESGVFAWWNNSQPFTDRFDLIDPLMWRNGTTGLLLGAYTGEFFVHGAEAYENAIRGIGTFHVDAFVQDSKITGAPAGNYNEGYGWEILTYFAHHSPSTPHWNVRNTFTDLPIGFTHVQDTCTVPAEEFIVKTIDCGPDFTVVASPTFNNVANPIRFGWQANANSWHRVVDYQESDSNGLTDFYLNRPDQLGVQGPESAAIIGNGGNTTYNSSFDALFTPYTGGFDYPPVVAMNSSMTGTVGTVDVQASDDGQVTKIEIVVDWNVVATCNNATTCSANYDFSKHPRNYAYVYARAYDDTPYQDKAFNQVAYTDVWEIGPESTVNGQTTAAPANVAPLVSAGVDQTITLPATANLDGTVTDDGKPNGTVSTSWSTVSGPGTATFASASAIDTSVSFSAAGAYVLRLTANDGALSDTDDVTISVNAAPVPVTPSPTPAPTPSPTPVPPAPTTTTVIVGSTQTSAGTTSSVALTLSDAPTGVAGYTLQLDVTDGTVARIASVQLGNGFATLDPAQDSMSDTSTTFSAVDANDVIVSGGSNILLATVNIEAVGEGSSALNLTIVALDDDGGLPAGAAVADGSFTGLNVAPAVAASPNAVNVSEGVAFSSTATITDAGDQQWNVSINYGDGSQAVSLPASGSSIALGHTYAVAGIYTVNLTVTDDDGALATTSVTVTVSSVCPSLPGLLAPATDSDGDGLCEDLNGNGRLDFDDVAEFFEHLSSVEIQSNPSKFDFNGSGFVDMDDIVHLFGMLLS